MTAIHPFDAGPPAESTPTNPVPEAISIREDALAAFGIPPSLAVSEEPAPTTAETAEPAAQPPVNDELLEAARQVLAAYRQQLATHRTAVLVEDAWTIVRHTATASEREVKAAERRRLRARKAFRNDWETYLHRSERLCRVAERVLGL
jgi:hypothetical protein